VAGTGNTVGDRAVVQHSGDQQSLAAKTASEVGEGDWAPFSLRCRPRDGGKVLQGR
jgi:hypothetical protein